MPRPAKPEGPQVSASQASHGPSIRDRAESDSGELEAFTRREAPQRVASTLPHGRLSIVEGRHRLAGTYEGREAAFASFAEEFELSGGTYAVEVHDSLANDEQIVALLHATAEREGERLDQDYVIVFEMRNGIVRAAWEV